MSVVPSFVQMHYLLNSYYAEEILDAPKILGDSNEIEAKQDKETKPTESEKKAEQEKKALRRKELEGLWINACDEMSKLDPNKAVELWVKLTNQNIQKIFESPDGETLMFGGWKRKLVMAFNAVFLGDEFAKLDSRIFVEGYWNLSLLFTTNREKALPASRFMMGRLHNSIPNLLLFRYSNEKGEVQKGRLILQLDKKFRYQDGRVFNSVESFIEAMEKEKGVKGISYQELFSMKG